MLVQGICGQFDIRLSVSDARKFTSMQCLDAVTP